MTSSPSFDSRLPPQHGQLVGPAITTRSRSILSGKGLRTGRLRWKERIIVFGGACSAASSSSVVEGFDFLELQFHLIKEPRRTFKALAVNLATELLDFELKIGDQRFVAETIRLRFGGLGARFVKVGASARQFAFRRNPRRKIDDPILPHEAAFSQTGHGDILSAISS